MFILKVISFRTTNTHFNEILGFNCKKDSCCCYCGCSCFNNCTTTTTRRHIRSTPTKNSNQKNASGGGGPAAPEKQLQEEETEETPQLTAEPIKLIERPQPQPQHDDDPNSFPAHLSLTRPGAPTVAPIFKNSEDMQEWQKNEYNENHKYSNQIHSEKVQAWRQRVNWHIVPSMTSITPEEKALGFIKVYKPYYQVDEETRFSTLNPTFPLPPDYGYLVPWNSTIRNIHPEFLALLFHNRAHELCKCKTVEDFEKVYIEGAKLHWNPLYWQSQVQQFTPEAALWTMSTNANMWPGTTIVPRPDVCRGLSGSASALAHYGIKKRRNMKFMESNAAKLASAMSKT